MERRWFSLLLTLLVTLGLITHATTGADVSWRARLRGSPLRFLGLADFRRVNFTPLFSSESVVSR